MKGMVVDMEQKEIRWDVPVVIPSYEPDEKLPGLLRELKTAGFKNIVLVDDGSGAAYAHFFTDARETYGCRVLHHAVNQGKGRALKTAFNYCLGEFPGMPGGDNGGLRRTAFAGMYFILCGCHAYAP